MSRLRAALFVASASLLTGGCVAAAIPVVVGGAIARDTLRDKDAAPPPAAPTPAATSADDDAALQTPQARAALDAFMGKPATIAPTGPGAPEAAPPPVAAGAAGEDAARSLQAYQALWTYLSGQVARRKAGEPVRSVVLDTGATLDAPRYAPCETRPLAILFDIDENPDKATDRDAAWRRWKGDGSDSIIAVPGAVEGIEAARREGVTVIFSTARSPSGAAGVAAALDRLGFGRVEPGKTLQLRGQNAADGVRRTIAAGYCVIALVGDSIKDFSDLFETAGDGRQPAAVTDTMVAPLWGAGWFLLPNPVRSTATPSTNPAGVN